MLARLRIVLLCCFGVFASWGGAANASALPAETAVFSGGCFWGVEAVFRHTRGVSEAVSGYTGGSAATANYGDVSRGDTGHAETVRVRFDPGQVSYEQLLQVFFLVAHDPTQADRQGPDVGSQYRSVIWFVDRDQQDLARQTVKQLGDARAFSERIVTQIVPLRPFYPAEPYHQDYVARHPREPYVVVHDLPKLVQLRRQFPQLYR